MKDKKKEPKLDFGPTKEDHGWFYYVWKWKTYAFYLLLIAGSIVAFLGGGIVGVVQIVAILYGLKFLGKLF